MSIIVNNKSFTGIKLDDVLANSDHAVKNRVLNTFLNNNSSLNTVSKGVIGAINELLLNSVSRFQSMPTPASSYANGLIYQYVGPTTVTAPIYKHGGFYECTSESGIYVWKEIDNGGGTITDVRVDGVSCVTGKIADIVGKQNQIYYGESEPSNPKAGDFWVYEGAGGGGGNYVTLDTAQTITGEKTFNSIVTFGLKDAFKYIGDKDEYIIKMPSNNGTIALKEYVVTLDTDQTISGEKTFTTGISIVGATSSSPSAIYQNDSILVTEDGMFSHKLKFPTIINFEDTIALKSDLDNLLPLNGSKSMTNSLKIKEGTDSIVNSVDNNYNTICGGTSHQKGSWLQLVGKDHVSAGWFLLTANDGTTSVQLVGKPDKTLTWNDKAIALAEDIAATYAAKATTLAGYGITDAYTKSQCDNGYNKKIVAATLGLTYASGWSADTSSRYVNRCYKITDNLYYICIFIKNSSAMTAGTSYTAINAGGLTIGGKVPYVCTLSAVDRTTQAVVGCWVNYEGKVYLVPSKAVDASDGICIAGILHTV